MAMWSNLLGPFNLFKMLKTFKVFKVLKTLKQTNWTTKPKTCSR